MQICFSIFLSEYIVRCDRYLFSPSLCNNFCFLILPASQTTLQPPVTPSAVMTRKPVGEEAGLSCSQGDEVDKLCSSEYMQNTTEIVKVSALCAAAFRLDYLQVMEQAVLWLGVQKQTLHGPTLLLTALPVKGVFTRDSVIVQCVHGRSENKGSLCPDRSLASMPLKTVALIERWECNCVIWHNWATEDMSADWGCLKYFTYLMFLFHLIRLIVYFCKCMQIKR